MTEEAAQVDENMPPLDDVVEETTETPEQIEASEQTESATATDTDTVAEPEKNKVQERINKITADKYAEKRRADDLEKRLADLEAANKAPEQAEPKLEDFDYDEAQFNIALSKYHGQKAANDAVSNYQTEQKQVEEGNRQAEIDANFNVKAEDFRKTAPDYDAVIEGLPMLPSDVLDAIMQHDKGPELAHYLGKHLDVADNINLLKLGEISAQLATKQPTKAPSAAPEPIDPVKPGGTLNKNPEEMSMEEVYAQD